MHQYLLGYGYWSYVDGANDAAPEPTHRDFLAWEQSASRVMYCFASCVANNYSATFGMRRRRKVRGRT